MPERRIPVLLPCDARKRDGFAALSDVSATSVSVRMVPQGSLRAAIDPRKRKAFESEYGVMAKRDRERLLYMLGLADAVSRRDPRKLERVVREYVSNAQWEDAALREIRRSPLYELQRNLNDGIRRIRFVVWWSERERRFAPGLLAEDATAALFALVLSQIGEAGGLSVCQRHNCQTPFIRVRAKQRYCSYRCQSAAGMARFRARKNRASRKRR
jgi:hypothetical protein